MAANVNIGSVSDLQKIGIIGGWGDDYILTNNIVIDETSGWTALSGQFTGSLDGNGYTITIQNSMGPSLVFNGLFHNSSGARFENLTIVVETNLTNALTNTGILANNLTGSGTTVVENCTVTSSLATKPTLYSSRTGNNNSTGGFIGVVNNTANPSLFINNSTFNIDIQTDAPNAGGLVGVVTSNANTVIITNSNVSGNISTNRAYSGGVIGGADKTVTLSNIAVTGNVRSSQTVSGGAVGSIGPAGNVIADNLTLCVNVTASNNTGGFVGLVNGNLTLQDIQITGSVQNTGGGASGNCAGGFIGYGNSTGSSTIQAENCTFEGNVTATSYVGGFAGQLNISSNISQSGVIANVSSNNNTGYAGGFVGAVLATNTTIKESYSQGNITGRNSGGFIGQLFGGMIQDCYSTADVISPTFSSNSGGFVGIILDSGDTTFENCYAAGNVTATITIASGSSAGGFVGAITSTTSGTQNVNVILSECMVFGSNIKGTPRGSVFVGNVNFSDTSGVFHSMIVQISDSYYWDGSIVTGTFTQPTNITNAAIDATFSMAATNAPDTSIWNTFGSPGDVWNATWTGSDVWLLDLTNSTYGLPILKWQLPTPIEYNITYSYQTVSHTSLLGTDNNPATYNITGTPLILNSSSIAGYTFIQWELNSTPGTAYPSIPLGNTGDLELVAVFADAPIEYNITYSYQTVSHTSLLGTDNNPATYNITGTPLTLNSSSIDGYTFIQWELNGTSGTAYPSIPLGNTGDLELVAVFADAPIEYNITYSYQTVNTTPLLGTDNNPATYNITGTPLTLNSSSIAGYTFIQWELNGTSGTAYPEIPSGNTGDLELVAVFANPTDYLITYSYETVNGSSVPGGSHSNPPTYDGTSAISLSAATASGYTFIQWEVTGTSGTAYTTIPVGASGPLSLVAVFADVGGGNSNSGSNNRFGEATVVNPEVKTQDEPKLQDITASDITESDTLNKSDISNESDIPESFVPTKPNYTLWVIIGIGLLLIVGCAVYIIFFRKQKSE